MRIALVHGVRLPVEGYGGTERLLLWLAKGLVEKGHSVQLVCLPGSTTPFGTVTPADFSAPIEPQVAGADVFHYFSTPAYDPKRPYLVTIGGNGKPGERFCANTVFVSRSHAEHHGSTRFVYNGVDPSEYTFSAQKDRSLLFLAKASWRVKNVQGAIRYARQTKRPLHILGGSRWWLPSWRGVRWEGMVGGASKARFLSEAGALLWPVIWNEPFGLAVVEAFLSGTPVVASRRGSSSELVHERVGFLCDTHPDFVSAIERTDQIRPADCRDWAWEQFHYHKMTDRYLDLYDEVLSGVLLNSQAPLGRGEAISPISD